MTDSVKEQLSALLDGELPPQELDLLLQRVARDPQLRDCVGRYGLVGETLRADKPVVAAPAFAAKVMAAIESEPAVAQPKRRISPVLLRSLRPVAGLAVAAGVATVAILAVQQQPAVPDMVVQGTAQISTPAVLQDPSYTVPTGNSSNGFVPATRLTNYVVAHSEYSSPLGRRTVLSGVLSEEDDVDPNAAADELTAPLESEPQER